MAVISQAKIALRWTSLDLSYDKSTLVQVMAWCRQVTSHNLNRCWPRSLPPYGVTRPPWVKPWHAEFIARKNNDIFHFLSFLNTKIAQAAWTNLSCIVHTWLTHQGRNIIAAISQTTFSNAFSWMKMHEFCLRFHWNLFLRFNNIPVLIQIMASCWPGDKPLSEPVLVRLSTHICVTRP